MAVINPDDNRVDEAVAQGGAYEIIRRRLEEQGAALKQSAAALNQARIEAFGSSDMAVMARVRVRTENNCIPRDIVQVGDALLFGYNVFIGLKNEIRVGDVFALFKLHLQGEESEIQELSLEQTFLAEPAFVKDFTELYRYYKNTRLIQLMVKDGKLLAAFQIGVRLSDIRVFRWELAADGAVSRYIDNRGERDIALPPAYDFEWQKAGRDQVVHGKHPHVNILDEVFVETVGGDLTVKIENNTSTGLGIYREPVDDQNQSIDDAEYQFAELGSLILLKILPYREEAWRYLVFNKLTNEVRRIDAIGSSCVQLPEDHGIVFPGGYYLQSGDYKTFDESSANMLFKRVIRSPNGEDVLYVFYEPAGGTVGLFAYNLIRKSLQNPIYGDGYALADDGVLVIFAALAEPTRVHPMQVWKTPFCSPEHASKEPPKQGFFGKVGNAELVRGVSDLYAVCRIIDNQSVTVRLYEELRRTALKLFDDHYWINAQETGKAPELLKAIASSSELAIDEFEKVQAIRDRSHQALETARQTQSALISRVRSTSFESAEAYVRALDELRSQRGHLATIRAYRYMDTAAIDALEVELAQAQHSLSENTVVFLADPGSLLPYAEKIEKFDQQIGATETGAELASLLEEIDSAAGGLDLLSELLATLKVGDANVRTGIVDGISEIYARLNQTRANARHKQKQLGSREAVAQFAAQFKLFSQSITNALALASTPEACDEQMARLLVQLEELESQFADHEQFLADIVAKREEVFEAFEGEKQRLLDERSRRAQAVFDAAERVLGSIERRAQRFAEPDALNTFFASDPLVLKIREFIAQLRQLGNAVLADDLEARFKSVKDQGVRTLRDKSDLFEEGGNVVKLGPRHKFSVNTQELDLTLLARGEQLFFHLSGTQYYEPVQNQELEALKAFWGVSLASESTTVYRAEFLAGQILQAALAHEHGLSMDRLHEALLTGAELDKLVRDFATPRYQEGYEKGLHDHDAAQILRVLLPALQQVDLLRFLPEARGFAQWFWADLARVSDQPAGGGVGYSSWAERARSAQQLQDLFQDDQALALLTEEVHEAMQAFLEVHPLPIALLSVQQAARYLVAELSRERLEFVASHYAESLLDELRRRLNDSVWREFQQVLATLVERPAERWKLASAWLTALVTRHGLTALSRYLPEAVAMLAVASRLERRPSEVDLEFTVGDLMGEHSLIHDRQLHLAVDAFLSKLERHREVFIPGLKRYLQLKQALLDQERKRLRLNEFKPRPLSSFVRNRLINEAYLPIIGDNFAKQMGTVGESKRTDLMGLLMLISPPGYGKTTLMEYVASRLGLVFMRINCPSLGHDVTSLDPARAPNATAEQELVKLNLALEMGNNVMLYLDDIQHTHPEFLQKFISLCDGTRRMEGIWRGQSKTYDLRGRKFCVVMAGNPYTESGEVFKIPDMLSNRADIYNLGDILGGMEQPFALSYIENTLTSNAVLAPLATRDIQDVYRFVKMAEGETVATTDLSHDYSSAEVAEITAVLRKLFTIRDLVLKVNQEYIRSAAQADHYRVEPPFKLQGSYRNMNKLAAKVSAVMNESELQQLIDDHYVGEAQLLTTGAEENLLKLAELRGSMTPEQKQRWQQIKADFLRNKSIGGEDADTGQQVVAQLHDLVAGLRQLRDLLDQFQRPGADAAASDRVVGALERLANNSRPEVTVINQPVPGLDTLLQKLTESIETTLYPMVRSMDKKLEIDLRSHYKMNDISVKLVEIERILQKELTTKKNAVKKPNPNPKGGPPA